MLRELVLGAASIVGTTLGMLVIAVFYQVAIELAESWWTWILLLGFATGLAVVALAVIYASLAATVAVSALGWGGMFAGRVPAGFGPGDRNLARAAGGLALFGLSAWAGLAMYRAGVRDGEIHWATEGMMLFAVGVLFGLGGALPRLYFAARARGNPVEDPRPRAKKKKIEGSDDVAVLFTLGVLAIALSMCTADTVVALRARDGVVTLAYGEWADGCVDSASITGDCQPRAELTLIPRRATRMRLEYLATCTVRITTADGGEVAVLSAGEMKRLGVNMGGTSDERARRIFDAAEGQRYRITVEPTGNDLCSYAVRYFEEPSR